MSAQVEITKAIIGALRADAALVALLADYTGTGGVFSHVPQDFDAYPYVVLYDIDLDNADNGAGNRFDGVINIHSWSDNRDITEIGNVMKAVYDVLHHDEFSMTGYTLVEINQQNQIILRDPDGITLHGVQRFAIMIQTN
jgi:hypothetical protein